MTEIRRVYKSEEKMKIVMEGLSGTKIKAWNSRDRVD